MISQFDSMAVESNWTEFRIGFQMINSVFDSIRFDEFGGCNVKRYVFKHKTAIRTLHFASEIYHLPTALDNANTHHSGQSLNIPGLLIQFPRDGGSRDADNYVVRPAKSPACRSISVVFSL